MTTDLSASLEDYIEAIFHIAKSKDGARVKEIARRLDVKKGSVTGALHSLADRGFINYTPYDVVTLTEKGRQAAGDVVLRHRTLSDFFVKVLSIPADEADEAACKMEHAVPPHVLDRLAAFADFVENCPRAGLDWIQRFREADEIDWNECEQCLEECVDNFEREKHGDE